jgi:hypothetical protein
MKKAAKNLSLFSLAKTERNNFEIEVRLKIKIYFETVLK